MDARAVIRCLPKRSILYLGFFCTIFFTCAFYLFFVDWIDNIVHSRKSSVALKFQNGNESSIPEPVVVSIRDTDPSNNRKEPDPRKILTRSGQLNIFNTSGNSEQGRLIFSFVTTKYNHFTNISSITTTDTKRKITLLPMDTCRLSMKNPKLILLWTPFFDYWDYFNEKSFSRCSRCRNCKVIKDKSRLLESDAVIFHARDLSIANIPSMRLPHQRWVFYCLESPSYSDFPGLQYTKNMFNWTMTYRADSDIQAPYGTITKIHPSRQLDLQRLKWIWSNKSKSVAWMTSHCRTDGGRDLFVKELQKYIDVDIYGNCGTYSCPADQTEKCYREFAQKYKFVLAFENSICVDYITEKFYRPLKFDIIPVVFGGADYDKFAPPGSFIDALKFKSPKHLAFFLSGVGNSFTLYSKFFQWRRNYSIDFSSMKECQLCSMLHRQDLEPTSYSNIRDWWVNGSRCKVWKPKQ